MKAFEKNIICAFVASCFLGAGFPVSASEAPDDVLSKLALRRAQTSYMAVDHKSNDKMRIHFLLDGLPVAADLTPHSVRSSRFTVRVPDGQGGVKTIASPPSRIYRGSIDSMPDSRISAVMKDGQLKATIKDSTGHVWGLQPSPVKRGLRSANANEEYVVYSSADAVDAEGTCTVAIAPAEEAFAAEDFVSDPLVASALSPTTDPGTFITEIAFDADYEYFIANGSSVDNVIADIESIVNSMNLIYERDVNITHDIVTIMVRTNSVDPYTTNESGDLLDQFDDEWTANFRDVDRDVAHLMTGKNLNGSTVGIAFLGVICRRFSAYGLSQSKYTTNFERRVALTAHEVGHNWDAEHCGSCNIMCATLGGCTRIVDSFSASAIAQIVAHRDSRSCLTLVPEELPDLAVSQSFLPAVPAVLDSVTITLSLTNSSIHPASSVVLENIFPANFTVDQISPTSSGSVGSDRVIWSINDLAGNQSFQASITGRYTSPGMIINRVEAGAAEQDLNSGDDADSQTLDIQPILTFSPESLSFTAEEGGPSEEIDCQTLTLFSQSDEAAFWSIRSLPAWVTVTPATGTVFSEGSLNLQVCINSQAETLPGGAYSEFIEIINQTDGETLLVPITLTILELAEIPFFDGFESGTIADYWTVTGVGTFRTQVTTQNGPAEGNWHLTLDDRVANSVYARNELTLALSTTGYTNWVLQFQAREYSEEADSPPSNPFTNGADFDGVAISVDGSQWYEVQPLRNLPNAYSTFSVNLTDELNAFGLASPELLYIRFNQYDNFSISTDGIAIDSVSVTGDRILDADFDGLPDDWETNYFPSVEAAIPSDDFDGDLYTNEEEYITDTDPVSSSSFQTFTIDLIDGIPQIGFRTSTARVYRVLQKIDPLEETWETLQNNQPGSGSTNFVPLSATNSSAIFRLEVELP